MRIRLFRALPEPLKRLIRLTAGKLPSRLRFGTEYASTRALLARADDWTVEELRRWQLNRLQKIVSRAYQDVPGYQQLYREAGVRPGDLQRVEDISHSPCVTKSLLAENLQDFTTRRIGPLSRIYRTTAGSTGIPFGFYLMPDAIGREYAFIHSAWERSGWKWREKSAVLRGAFVGSARQFWQYDNSLFNLNLSTYFLTRDSYPSYRDKCLSFRVQHLQAYPSSAAILADHVLESGLAPPPFRTLLLGSENLYPWQISRLHEAFPTARIFAWYGHAEQVLFAPGCEVSLRYHLEPLYGLAQLENSAGDEVREGEVGELIGTSLWPSATPFIRYRTMDLVEKGPTGCPDCGRPHQILNRVDGRLQELVVTATGRYLSMTALNMHTDVFDRVAQFQFRQSAPGELVLMLVPRAGFSNSDSTRVRNELCAKLGEDMTLDIQIAEEIPRTQSGKLRFLVQELPIRYRDNG